MIEWKSGGNLEHDKQYIITDGNGLYSVAYLSRWSSLWYHKVSGKGVNWRVAAYAELEFDPLFVKSDARD